LIEKSFIVVKTGLKVLDSCRIPAVRIRRVSGSFLEQEKNMIRQARLRQTFEITGIIELRIYCMAPNKIAKIILRYFIISKLNIFKKDYTNPTLLLTFGFSLKSL